MQILVTGGAGYIGSHIVLEAVNNGHDVTIFDNLSTSNEININSKAKFIEGSINSNKDLKDLFEKNEFDAVIHLAGSKSAGDSMINPSNYANNNIIGSLNLLDKCIKYKIKTFIFSSSASVYGTPKQIPIDESHPLNPLNYYGFTKMSVEQNLKWYSSSFGINYACLRYFNAAGYDTKKRVIGLESSPENLIPVIMEVVIGERSFVPIYGNKYATEDGTGIRDYVHVNDLAKAHLKAIDYVNKNQKNLIINLGSERGFSVFEILKMVEKITNTKIAYKIYNPRLGDADKIVASCSLASDLIGWKKKNSSLEIIIESTWKIYKLQY